MTVVAGIDACRGGWVAVVLDAGEFTDSLFSASFAQLLGSPSIKPYHLGGFTR